MDIRFTCAMSFNSRFLFDMCNADNNNSIENNFLILYWVGRNVAALSSTVIIRRGTRSQIKWCIPIQAWILMLVTSMKWARMLPAISAQWNGHHVFVKHDDVCIVSILCVYWSINRSVFCWKSTKILYGMFWVDPRSTTEKSNVFNVHCPSVDTSEEINQYHMHAHLHLRERQKRERATREEEEVAKEEKWE